MDVVAIYRYFYRLCNKVFPPKIGGRSTSCSDFVRSVKLVGLFVTALVGVYTVEDLWHKFGDLKMSLVSSFRVYSRIAMNSTGTARPTLALGGPRCLSYRHPDYRLHDNIQDSLPHPEPFRSWGFANELSVPSEFGRK